MTKACIQVYANAETKRRVELAAVRQGMPVTEYCLAAIKQRLVEDNMLERKQVEGPVQSSEKDNVIAELRILHQDILTYRNAELLDIDRDLTAVREAREEVLIDLC
jgi:hypothetical protein